jgi:putative endonuclease
MKNYFVYILSSSSRVLYTGITNSLERRAAQHKEKALPGFTQRYNTTRLVYFEVWGNARSAIAREKQIKAWRREKKSALIRQFNPRWEDLAADGRIRLPRPPVAAVANKPK